MFWLFLPLPNTVCSLAGLSQVQIPLIMSPFLLAGSSPPSRQGSRSSQCQPRLPTTCSHSQPDLGQHVSCCSRWLRGPCPLCLPVSCPLPQLQEAFPPSWAIAFYLLTSPLVKINSSFLSNPMAFDSAHTHHSQAFIRILCKSLSLLH